MLLYTGAIQNEAIQQDASKSLGGWVSSSQIQNNVIHNLFSKIDYNQVKNDLKPIRVVAFKNTTGSIITSLKVWIEHEATAFATYKIGLVLNSIETTCNHPYFEQIQNQYAEPFYCQLLNCETELNAIELTNIPIDQFVGIFVQRNLIAINNEDLTGATKTCENYSDEYNATLVPDYIEPKVKDEDEIKIIIDIT